MEQAHCAECGQAFLRLVAWLHKPQRKLCSQRCVMRRWRRRHPGLECHHGRVHSCRKHGQC